MEYGYREEINEIISSLKQCNIKLDFEAIVNVIEGLIEIKQGIKQAGPFTANICKELNSIRGIPCVTCFPNGVPAMVGENMNELMDQVHVQNLMPEEAKMVPVMLATPI